MVGPVPLEVRVGAARHPRREAVAVAVAPRITFLRPLHGPVAELEAMGLPVVVAAGPWNFGAVLTTGEARRAGGASIITPPQDNQGLLIPAAITLGLTAGPEGPPGGEPEEPLEETYLVQSLAR